jgi:hypothetical protein
LILSDMHAFIILIHLNLSILIHIFVILLIEHNMELQSTNNRLGQSSYRQNLLDTMAKSSIKYIYFYLDVIKLEVSYMLVQVHLRSTLCKMMKTPN